MAILSDEDVKWVPQRVLVIAPTKIGKTDWVAQAIKDGYEVIYVDIDNGLPTIKRELKGTDGWSRLHYFSPNDGLAFVIGIFFNGIWRWNETQNVEFNRVSCRPSDVICEIYPARIPPRVILVIDTWTSLTYQALAMKARALKVDLSDIEKYGRELYAPSGFIATQILQSIQQASFGCIVQAHPGTYERKEKPPGKVEGIKEKDMIIIDTTQIPISTSGPHGFTVGKYFTQIANMYIKPRVNERVIDFTTIAGRIGGGTPDGTFNPRKDGRYSVLFGHSPLKDPNEKTWIRYLTFEEYLVEADAKKGAPSSVIPQPRVISPPPSAAAGATAVLGVSQSTPAAQGLGLLMKKA